MCGIAGIVAADRAGVDPARLAALGTALAHRGPDGSGTWRAPDGRVGFAHRRLAIIDPDPRSDQPMRSADGALTVTYNGELYNHRELRVELERMGRRFRTTSDTEVLVEALAAWGADAVPRFRGMFAFAAHDARSGEVLLARDALGIKPLHHARSQDGAFVFASEVRALRPLVPAGISAAAAADLLLWGSIAAPRTCVAGVSAMPAGSLLRVRGGEIVEERWAAPTDWSPADNRSTEADLVSAVHASVEAHLVADVPVAVFLSSGIDSRVVTSIAARSGSVTALTVRDPDADETPAAARWAGTVGVEHVVVDVPTRNAGELLDAAAEALDQPSVDGVNSYVVARAAADAGFRVALSGVGGDELFGGYPSAARLPALAGPHRLLRPAAGAAPSLLRWPIDRGWDRGGPVGRARWVAAHAGLAHGPYLVTRGVFAPAEVAAFLDLDLAEVLRTAEERLSSIEVPPSHPAYPSASESSQYLRHQLLRDVDATAMASSVEVRTPLVDASLLAAAAGVPQTVRTRGPAKAALRAASLHDLAAPTGAKQGFSVPMARWIRTGSAPLDAATAAGDARMARRVVTAAREGRAHWSRAWLLEMLGRERGRAATHG